MDITGFLVGCLVGIVATILSIWYHANKLLAEFDAFINEEIQKRKDDVLNMRVEKANGVYYCYNNDNGVFLCQGASMSEIDQAFKNRFPNQKAVISDGDDATIDELTATLNTIKK